MESLLAAASAGLLLLPLLPALPPLWAVLLPVPPLLLAARRWPACLLPVLFLLTFAWSVHGARAAVSAWLPPALEGQSLQAEGVVEGLADPLPPRGVRFRFRVLQARHEDGSAAVAGGLWQLFVAQDGVPPPGARCTLLARLKRPHGSANPGGFDYEAWLLEEGVTATGSAQALLCGPPPPGIDLLRLHLRQVFAARFPGQPEAGVVLALISGDRALIPDAAWQRYIDTGVVHLMAISGMHITLLAVLTTWLAVRLLRRFPRLALHVPLPRPALLAGLAVAVVYSLVAGLSVPTERTLVMLALVVAARLYDVHLGIAGVLLLALLAVLLWSPLAVHGAGLWLSFGAVAVLVLAGEGLRGLPAWRQGLQLQFLMSLLLLPLTLWFFGRVSWVSPLANLLAVPLVTFAIVPLGLLGLLAWLLLPAVVSTWIWQAAVVLMTVLDALLQQFQSWPGACLGWALPGWGGLVLVLLAVTCLVQPLQWRLRLLAPFLLLPLFWRDTAPAPGTLRLTVVDVGQGLAVLVETRHYRLLYDAGPVFGPGADAGSRFVLPLLYRQGIHALDRLLLSHDDNDHTGGANAVLAALPVTDVLGARPANLRLPPGTLWRPCRAGQAWREDGWDFRVVYPDAADLARARKDNDRSCVLRISRGRAAVLMPGDLETWGEDALLARSAPAALTSTVLVLGHHGSRTATSPAFLAAVAPRWALVSAGYRNQFHHPSPVVLVRLQKAGVPWRNTAMTGALQMELDDAGVKGPRAFRCQERHYWSACP
jgi:competence protein ComEC